MQYNSNNLDDLKPNLEVTDTNKIIENKNEINNIIKSDINNSFELDKYSEFTIKDSLFSRICSFLLRKKVLIFIASSLLSVVAYKLFKTQIWNITE